MISDCMEYAKKKAARSASTTQTIFTSLRNHCTSQHAHGRLPPEVGAFTPPSSAGHQSLLAATDYFSKWAEAIAVMDFKNTTVSEFIRTHIIYRFGIPDSIISDNEQPFISSFLYRLYAK